MPQRCASLSSPSTLALSAHALTLPFTSPSLQDQPRPGPLLLPQYLPAPSPRIPCLHHTNTLCLLPCSSEWYYSNIEFCRQSSTIPSISSLAPGLLLHLTPLQLPTLLLLLLPPTQNLQMPRPPRQTPLRQRRQSRRMLLAHRLRLHQAGLLGLDHAVAGLFCAGRCSWARGVWIFWRLGPSCWWVLREDGVFLRVLELGVDGKSWSEAASCSGTRGIRWLLEVLSRLRLNSSEVILSPTISPYQTRFLHRQRSPPPLSPSSLRPSTRALNHQHEPATLCRL